MQHSFLCLYSLDGMSLAISRILISFYKYRRLYLLGNYHCQGDIALTRGNAVTEEQKVLVELQKKLSLAHSYSMCAGQNQNLVIFPCVNS